MRFLTHMVYPSCNPMPIRALTGTAGHDYPVLDRNYVRFIDSEL
jgi:hypothetical protein